MLKAIRQRKAQSTLEYAILVVVIIAALLSLQTYVKQGIQGRLRQSSDDIGDQFSVADSATYNRKVVSTSTTTDTNVAGLITSKKAGDISSNTESHVTLE